MNAPQPPASFRNVSAERGALLRTLAHLWPYIWPSDRGDPETGGAIAALSGAAGNAATTSVRETVGGVKAGADANCSVGRTAGCGATTAGGVTVGAAFTG